MTFEDNTNMNHKGVPDFKGRIQFEPVQTDAEAVYGKIRQRILNDKIISFGISPAWKYVSIAAIPGTKVKVTLPDSSTVWLNSNAKIRYPQTFSSDNRIVEFKGEGLFKVKHNARQPFIVDADGLKIKVLGTEFNVYTNTDRQIVETTLLNRVSSSTFPKTYLSRPCYC